MNLDKVLTITTPDGELHDISIDGTTVWTASELVDETDTTAGDKTIPSGAHYESVLSVGGKSVVMNQCVHHQTISETTKNGITYSCENGVFTLNGTCTETFIIPIIVDIANNHNYYIKSGSYLANKFVCVLYNTQIPTNNGIIKNNPTSTNSYLAIYANANLQNVKATPLAFDLTQMFGAGNEPTVEEFEAMFPADYYPYNEGEIVSAGVSGWDLVGASLFKAEEALTNDLGWGSAGVTTRISGYYGACPIPVIGGKKYYRSTSKVGNANYYLLSDGTKINQQSKSNIITTPANAIMWYFNIETTEDKDTVVVYKGDTERDVKPYHETTTTIPTSITSLTGYGWSAGSVYNEVDFENKRYIQRVSRVDLGSLEWFSYDDTNKIYYSEIISDFRNATTYNERKDGILTSAYSVDTQVAIPSINDKTILNLNKRVYIRDTSYTDATTFKTAMNGVMLYYELSEPIITDLSDILDDLTPTDCEAGGSITYNYPNKASYNLPVPNSVLYKKKVYKELN